MNKKILVLAGIGGVLGAGLALFRSPARTAAADDAFPAEKLAGAATNLKIKIVEGVKGVKAETDEGSKPEGLLTAVAVLPFGVRAEQIAPSGYAALKSVRASYPKAAWIAAFLAEDSALAETSNWVGLAQYRKGEVFVTGGLPGPAQLDSLMRAGASLRRPTPDDIKLAAAVFDSSYSLAAARRELSRGLIGANPGALDKSRFLTLDFETAPLHKAAKAMGRDPKEAREAVLNLCRYYWLNAGRTLVQP